MLCVRDDLADSFAQILGEGRELVAVAYGTETVHDSVATSIDAIRLGQPDQRLDGFSREFPLRWHGVVGHEAA